MLRTDDNCDWMVIQRAERWWGAGSVNVRVNAHPSPFAVSKSYFFQFTCFFAGVRLFAYRFRRLSDGFRP